MYCIVLHSLDIVLVMYCITLLNERFMDCIPFVLYYTLYLYCITLAIQKKLLTIRWVLSKFPTCTFTRFQQTVTSPEFAAPLTATMNRIGKRKACMLEDMMVYLNPEWNKCRMNGLKNNRILICWHSHETGDFTKRHSSPMAETADLKSAKCGFESHLCYQKYYKKIHWQFQDYQIIYWIWTLPTLKRYAHSNMQWI